MREQRILILVTVASVLLTLLVAGTAWVTRGLARQTADLHARAMASDRLSQETAKEIAALRRDAKSPLLPRAWRELCEMARKITNPTCCCGGTPCYDTSPNTSTQPNLTLAGCSCPDEPPYLTGGDYADGTWALWTPPEGGHLLDWSDNGSSPCGVGYVSHIWLDCNATTGKWEVSATIYDFSVLGGTVYGAVVTDALTVTEAGVVTGSVSMDLYDLSDNFHCTLEIEFGA